MPTFPLGHHAYLTRVRNAKTIADAKPAEPERRNTVIGQHTPADKKTLRGIPVVGGLTGTSPGTDPLLAVLAAEHARERQAA